jgi:hypothetical protein
VRGVLALCSVAGSRKGLDRVVLKARRVSHSRPISNAVTVVRTDTRLEGFGPRPYASRHDRLSQLLRENAAGARFCSSSAPPSKRPHRERARSARL